MPKSSNISQVSFFPFLFLSFKLSYTNYYSIIKSIANMIVHLQFRTLSTCLELRSFSEQNLWLWYFSILELNLQRHLSPIFYHNHNFQNLNVKRENPSHPFSACLAMSHFLYQRTMVNPVRPLIFPSSTERARLQPLVSSRKARTIFLSRP